MKTVEVVRDFDYVPHRMLSIRFEAGNTYRSVLEAAANAIVAAGAGRVVTIPIGAGAAGSIVDTRHVWRR